MSVTPLATYPPLLRTLVRPGPEALLYAVDMAERSLAALRGLVEQGTDATTGAGAGAADNTAPPLSEWLRAFCAPPDTLDAVILLREDSLPRASQVGGPLIGSSSVM